jgi:uncharacterized repeat protein (TIGR03803 family)
MKSKLLAVFLLLPLFAVAQTYTYSTLVSFPPQSKKGPATPNGYLTIDSKGNLYGAAGGGTRGQYGDGTIFKATPKGVLTVLHNFGGSDGLGPQGAVVFDKAGNLYGTTQEGGAHNWGTVYKLTPKNVETVLYSFRDTPEDGNYPVYPVTLDSSGNVFGYTYYTVQDQPSSGAIYRVTPEGNFSIVYTFGQNQGYDGFNPVGSMITDSEGNFYGTASQGGDFDACGLASGVVFKMTPDYDYTVLHTFCPNTGDVASPRGKLTQDNEGNMYGGGGGIFKITQTGDESVINNCCFNPPFTPQPLVRDSAGNLYGVVSSNSTTTNSYVVKIGTDGTETVLYTSVMPVNIGEGLVLDSAGNIYGTTFNGGVNGTGSIFKLTKKAN